MDREAKARKTIGDDVLEDHREFIVIARQVNQTVDDILAALHADGVKVTRSTLYRSLKSWDALVQKQPPTAEQIQLGVLPLALTSAKSDKEIASSLAGEFGINVSHRQVKRARLKARALRRFDEPNSRQARASSASTPRDEASSIELPAIAPRVVQVDLPCEYHTFSPQNQRAVKDALHRSTTSMLGAGYEFHTFFVTPEGASRTIPRTSGRTRSTV